MKLAAAMIVRNEMGRFLQPAVESLLSFCDEVRVIDDGSTDGTREWLDRQERVAVSGNDGDPMFEHEGRARNQLLQWTFAGAPTHVLSIDADEFVTDGAAVRRACESDQGVGVWTLGIQEVWKANADGLWLRSDGAWNAQAISPLLWRAPSRGNGWKIPNVQLACGREPIQVRRFARRGVRIPADVLHFGWTNQAERAARYQRYVEHDGGRFHNLKHLNSIMYPDRQVRLARRDWPDGLDRWKYALTARVAA